MVRALEGIKILDATIFQHGPGATCILGYHGAEVIKLEDTKGGDPGRLFQVGFGIEKAGMNTYFEALNRGKKSIAVDLKTPEGREVVYRLVKHMDVFVHNFRTGVAERLGVDFETLKQHNPQLVYAWATGWGPVGPDKDKPSLDLAGQARGGIMTVAGEPDIPGQIPGVADQTGAFILAQGIMLALIARLRHGVGQMVTTSHLGSQVALMHLFVTGHSFSGGVPRQLTRTKARNPLWNTYRCADDRWVALSMSQGDRYWEPFCRAVGRTEWIDDPRFKSARDRGEHRDEIIPLMDEMFAQHPRDRWMREFEKEDLIYAPIQSYPEVVQDPQVLLNGYVVERDYPDKGARKIVGAPVQLSETPADIRVPAPDLGEHTDEVLQKYGGYTQDEIMDLRIKNALF